MSMQCEKMAWTYYQMPCEMIAWGILSDAIQKAYVSIDPLCVNTWEETPIRQEPGNWDETPGRTAGLPGWGLGCLADCVRLHVAAIQVKKLLQIHKGSNPPPNFRRLGVLRRTRAALSNLVWVVVLRRSAPRTTALRNPPPYWPILF